MAFLGSPIPSRTQEFEAQETVISGKRAIALTCKPVLAPAVRVDLTYEVEKLVELGPGGVRGSTNPPGFPAAYQYLAATSERQWPLIRIVAGPGVAVDITPESRPPREPWALRRFPSPVVDVFRVQDPDAVPPMATDIDPRLYTGTDGDAAGELQVIDLGYGPGYDVERPVVLDAGDFLVRQWMTEVWICHPWSKSILVLKLPGENSRHQDARARFAYELVPGRSRLSSGEVRVVKTKEVELRLLMELAYTPLLGTTSGRESRLPSYSLYEVDDILLVPAQGEPLVPQPAWGCPLPLESINREVAGTETFGNLLLDLGIGQIPVVSSLIDAGEALAAWATGKDRRGLETTVGGRVVMSLCALIQLIGLAAKLGQVFGRTTQETQHLLRGLQRAHLTDEEHRLIGELAARIRSGGAVTEREWKAVRALLGRVEAKPTSIEALLNRSRTGFVDPRLQAEYRRFAYKEVLAGRRPRTPREWASLPQKGTRAGRLFDVVYQCAKAPGDEGRFFLTDIVLPKGYSSEKLAADIARVWKGPQFVLRRLRDYIKLAAKNYTTPAGLKLSMGFFVNIRGKITESLAFPEQLKRLKEIAGSSKRFEKAQLIIGVKIRRMVGGKLKGAKDFTDGVVVIREKGGSESLRSLRSSLERRERSKPHASSSIGTSCAMSRRAVFCSFPREPRYSMRKESSRSSPKPKPRPSSMISL
jgi:hypothetical protein